MYSSYTCTRCIGYVGFLPLLVKEASRFGNSRASFVFRSHDLPLVSLSTFNRSLVGEIECGIAVEIAWQRGRTQIATMKASEGCPLASCAEATQETTCDLLKRDDSFTYDGKGGEKLSTLRTRYNPVKTQ